MKWYNQIRWKLFVAHLITIMVAMVALLTTANIIAGVGLVHDASLYPNASPQESALLERFQVVFQESLIAAAFAALVAAILMSLFVSRAIVEPLQQVTQVSHKLAEGFYRERTTVTTDDELAELSRSVNQLAEALEQTEQQRRALLADVTHELRTPLATIEGYMEGLIDGVVRPDTQTFSLILRESVRMQRLIEDLELLSRAEAGQIQILPRPLDLRSRLEGLMIQFTAQFEAKQIALELIAPPIPLPSVYADPDRFDQVVINLLSNALRYTSSGGRVTLRIRGEDRHAIVSVQDTGIGIAPEHLPQIFERFYRVDKSRARASGGSGIGLTVARHLVYAQGGDIRAMSDGMGKGATFLFTLPWATMPAPDETLPPGTHA